jgi:NAD(P)-dependent dehydrogenase (short-subunit alcohol dehydrogenase family)
MRIVITGANRGIGLELTRQYLEGGQEVVAAVRSPEKAKELQALKERHPKLTVLACDVSDEQSVRRAAGQVPGPVDVLINNAGVMGHYASLEELDLEDAAQTFSANALGPVRVTRALLPQLRQSQVKKVMNITSGMGSIGDNRSGGAYAYRMSKAALNMATRSMAVDLKDDGILVAVINPGWVKTDMGGAGAPTAVKDSVAGIRAQVEGLTAAKSGEFLDFSGKRWEW